VHDRAVVAVAGTTAVSAKIIIIDDDEAVRDSLRALLECCGYGVTAYASAEDFLTQHLGGADFLLVDHHMPGMTGLDLLERLRARGDHTPALMITGRADPVIQARLQRVGVPMLQKPLEADQLVRGIEEARTGGKPAHASGADGSPPSTVSKTA
jgi:two-component system, LuxR family, response regulator FixJ